MNRHPVVTTLGALLGVVTVVVGWTAVPDGDGGAGTVWLLTAATVATLGLVAFAWFARADRAVAAGAALAVVCVSPTVFAYPLNGVVLVLAGTLVGLGLADRRGPAAVRRARRA